MTSIRLHKFGPAFGLPDPSPFVHKVETYLRMTGQAYESVVGDVRKAPRAQLPVLEIDGQRIPDSTAIVEHVEAARAHKLDARLGPRERGIALAFKSMLEEHLYFGMLFLRWATDEGWAVFEPAVRKILGEMQVPALLRGMVAQQARAATIRRTKAQGMGRKPRSEVVAICSQLLDALAVQLGEGPYFCGAEPTTYDATVHAFVAGVLCPAFDNELRRHAAAKRELVAYHERIEQRYWQSGSPSPAV